MKYISKIDHNLKPCSLVYFFNAEIPDNRRHNTVITIKAIITILGSLDSPVILDSLLSSRVWVTPVEKVVSLKFRIIIPCVLCSGNRNF